MAEQKKQATLWIFLTVIFVLSFAVGYVAKSLAKNKISVGIDDNEIYTTKDEYQRIPTSEKVKEIREEKQRKAQQNQPQQAPQADQGGGSCTPQ